MIVNNGYNSEIQRDILLRRKLKAVSNYTSELTSDEGTSVKEKELILEKGLFLITEIELNKPNNIDELLWMNTYQIRLMFAASLLNFWGKGGNLRTRGIANVLSNILIGLRKVDSDKLLTNKNDPEFLSRFALAFNILNENFILFSSIINSLNQINLTSHISWLNKAILNLNELIVLLRSRWDVMSIYKRGGFNNFEFVFSVYINSIDLLLEIYSKFRKYPEMMQNNVIFDSSNDTVFLQSISKLQFELADKVAELKSHDKKNNFGRNNHISDSKALNNVFEEVKRSSNILIIHSLINNTIDNYSNINIELCKMQLDEITEFLNEESYINEDILNTSMGESTYKYMNKILLLAGFITNKTNDLQLLDNLRIKFGVFLTNPGIQRYPSLYALYSLIRFVVICNLGLIDNIKEISDDLLFISSKLFLDPRSEFAFNLLGNLSKYISGGSDKSEFCFWIDSVKNYVMENIYNPRLVSEINVYLSCIGNTVDGLYPEYNFERLNNPNPFDPYAIFIPNLDKLAKKREINNLIYLPFNLATDYIVDI